MLVVRERRKKGLYNIYTRIPRVIGLIKKVCLVDEEDATFRPLKGTQGLFLL